MVTPNEAGVDRVARDRDEVVELLTRMVHDQVPGWTATSSADLGVTLIELLASAADRLAYEQDAVATEAYIGTARRRTSIVRHARLLDVAVHYGCNARTWLHLEAATDTAVSVPRGTVVFTRVDGFGVCVSEPPPEGAAVVFETMQPAVITANHNSFVLAAPLPEGSTRATLRGHWDSLVRGDVLCLGVAPGQVVRLTAPPQISGAERYGVPVPPVRVNPESSVPSGSHDTKVATDVPSPVASTMVSSAPSVLLTYSSFPR